MDFSGLTVNPIQKTTIESISKVVGDVVIIEEQASFLRQAGCPTGAASDSRKTP